MYNEYMYAKSCESAGTLNSASCQWPITVHLGVYMCAHVCIYKTNKSRRDPIPHKLGSRSFGLCFGNDRISDTYRNSMDSTAANPR